MQRQADYVQHCLATAGLLLISVCEWICDCLLLLSAFEIPDVDTDRLMTPADIVQYIADRNDVYDEH